MNTKSIPDGLMLARERQHKENKAKHQLGRETSGANNMKS